MQQSARRIIKKQKNAQFPPPHSPTLLKYRRGWENLETLKDDKQHLLTIISAFLPQGLRLCTRDIPCMRKLQYIISISENFAYEY